MFKISVIIMIIMLSVFVNAEVYSDCSIYSNCQSVSTISTGSNGTTETDPIATAIITTNNASWSSTYNSTYNGYNSTGLIKNWNATGYIKNWNSTGHIINWTQQIPSNYVKNNTSAGYKILFDYLQKGSTVPGIAYTNSISVRENSAQANHIIMHNDATSGFGSLTISNGASWNSHFGRIVLYGKNYASDPYMSADGVDNQGMYMIHSQGAYGMAVGSVDSGKPFYLFNNDRVFMKENSTANYFYQNGVNNMYLDSNGITSPVKLNWLNPSTGDNWYSNVNNDGDLVIQAPATNLLAPTNPTSSSYYVESLAPWGSSGFNYYGSYSEYYAYGYTHDLQAQGYMSMPHFGALWTPAIKYSDYLGTITDDSSSANYDIGWYASVSFNLIPEIVRYFKYDSGSDGGPGFNYDRYYDVSGPNDIGLIDTGYNMWASSGTAQPESGYDMYNQDTNYYKVYAYANSQTAWSEGSSVFTGVNSYYQTYNGKVGFSLSWDAVAGAEGYRVFKSTNSGSTYEEYIDTADPYFDDVGAGWTSGSEPTPSLGATTKNININSKNIQMTDKTLTIYNNNTDYPLNTSTSHLILKNDAGTGQSIIGFKFGDYILSGIRGDYAGNLNWHGSGYQAFYSSLDTTNHIFTIDDNGMNIGGTAGASPVNEFLDVTGGIWTDENVTGNWFNGNVLAGNSTGNVTIDEDGLILDGTATQWDDISVGIANLKINPLTSKPDEDTDNVWFLFDDSTTETVRGAIQTSHSQKNNTPLYCHVHWKSPATGNVTWNLNYTLDVLGSNATSTWISLNASSSVFGNNTINMEHLTPFSPTTNITSISTIMRFKLSRLGGATTDTMTGDAYFQAFDCHYEKDSLGSKEEYIK